jgi:hypothetical protein
MAALFSSNRKLESGKTSGLARWLLRRVLDLLEEHAARDIGLNELAGCRTVLNL